MKRILMTLKTNIRTTVWRYYAFVFLRSFMLFSGVLVPFFTQWGGLTLFQVQLVQSWFMLCVFLLEVPTGAIADHLGRKHSLVVSAFIATIAALVYGSFPRFEIFLLGEFLFAAAFSLMSGADQALLYDSLKEAGKESESKKIINRAQAVSLAGIGISAPIGGIVASYLGLSAPMLLTAIPLFLAGIVAWTMKEPKFHDKHSETKQYGEIIKKGFTFFYTHKALRIMTFDAILVASAAYFVIWFFQPLLSRVGVPIIYFGFVQAFLIVIEILIASNFVRLEKVFGSAKVLLRWSALAVAVAFFLVALMPNLVTIIIFIMVAGGFGLTRLELMTAYMQKFIPSEQRATVLSSISMFRRFALVILNPLIGLVADHSLQVALLLAGILPLIVFLYSPIEKEMLE